MLLCENTSNTKNKELKEMRYDFYFLMCFIIYLIVFKLHFVVLIPNMTFLGQLNGN